MTTTLEPLLLGNGLEGRYVVKAPGDGSLVWSFTEGRETEAESFEPRPAAWERVLGGR